MLDDLNRRFDAIKERYDEVTLRLRRALSWAERAERAWDAEDPDAACIFFWIAFNALYAHQENSHSENQEQRQFQEFLDKVRTRELDKDRTIVRALQECWAYAKRDLIDNQYVSRGYWGGEPGWASKPHLREEFQRECDDAARAARRGDHGATLRILFDRIYVLRNQLHHGGSTQAGSLNRQQVEAGAAVTAKLVPAFIGILLDHPDDDWGKPYFPPKFDA